MFGIMGFGMVFCFSFNFVMSLFTDQIYKAEYYSWGV